MRREHHQQHPQHQRRSREVNGDAKQQWSNFPNNHIAQPHHQARYPPPIPQPNMPPPPLTSAYEGYNDGWTPATAGGSRYPPIDRPREQWDVHHSYHHEEQRAWEPSMPPPALVAHEPRHYERSWDRDDQVQRGWEPPAEQPRSLKRGTWNREPASWDRPADYYPNDANRSWVPQRQQSQNSSHQQYHHNGDGHQYQSQGQNRKRKRKNQGNSTSTYKQPNHYPEEGRLVFAGDSNGRNGQSTAQR